MTGNADIRAGDDDRDRVADRLRQAVSEGRISLDELQERLDRTYAARTLGDLEPIVADLPGPPVTDLPGPQTATSLPGSQTMAGRTGSQTVPGLFGPETVAGPSGAETGAGPSGAETGADLSGSQTGAGLSGAETVAGLSGAQTEAGLSGSQAGAGLVGPVGPGGASPVAGQVLALRSEHWRVRQGGDWVVPPRIDIRLGVWGTATLDFRAARCPYREVLIDVRVTSWFGDVHMKVPHGWRVRSDELSTPGLGRLHDTPVAPLAADGVLLRLTGVSRGDIWIRYRHPLT